jgi:hypothetical protein
MRKQVTSIIAGLWFFFCASSVFAQKVNTDWDHEANFSNYKTYAWIETKHPAVSDLTNKRIVENIDKQLAAKGFTKVIDNAAALVVYNAGVKEQVSVEGYNYGYGRYRWGGGMTTYSKVVELQGTLVIDLVDSRKKELVWRGTATDTLSDKPEKNAQKIEKATEKLFKKYPPKAK